MSSIRDVGQKPKATPGGRNHPPVAQAPRITPALARELLAAHGSVTGARVEQLLNLFPDAVHGCDATGRITFSNRRALELWGREPRVNDDCETFFAGFKFFLPDGTLVPTRAAPIAIAVRDGRATHGFEATVERPDGSRAEVCLTTEPVRDDAGRLCGAIAIFQDITERKRQRRHERLLAALGDAMAEQPGEADLVRVATRMLAEHLGVQRCGFFEADEALGEIVVADGWRREGLPSVAGTHPAGGLVQPEVWAAIGAAPLVVDDVTTHPLTAAFMGAYFRLSVGAFVACACGKARPRFYALGVASEAPRAWTADEVGLLENVVARLWPVVQRARSEAAQRGSEARLRLALSAANLGDWSWDAATDMVRLSPRAAEIFGLTPGSCMTWKEMRGLLHPDDAERARMSLERAFGERSDYDIEYRVRRGQGEWAWMAAKGRGTYGFEGAVVGIVGVVQEITARKRDEERLRESEQRLRLATRTGKVGLWDWDIATNRVTWTDSLYEIHGVNPATFPLNLDSFTSLIHPDDRGPVQRAIQSSLEHGAPYELEFRAVQPGGAMVWLFTTATVSREDARALRLTGATFDITARKIAELALRESEERFRALASHAPVGIFLTDATGDCVFVNENWRELAGFSNEQACGQGWVRAVHPEDRERVVAEWQAALAARRPYAAEYRFMRPDGTVAWLQGSAVEFRKVSGEPGGYIGIIVDITERKAAGEKLQAQEAQLRAHAAELEHRVRERTASLREAIVQMEEFSYSVSHDLRAPLRAMNIYAQALGEDYGPQLDATARDYLERIQRSSVLMEKLTHDVLSYSRVARAELKLKPLDVESVLKDLISQYTQLQPPAANVEIIGPLPPVQGHESSLGQCLANLLTNAAKFVPPGIRPHIRVFAAPAGPHVRLWIEDNGIGIDPCYQERLFRVFERVPTKHAYDGTGIGLSIVRKAVEKMGGRCGVESTGSNGSRFWLELPKA